MAQTSQHRRYWQASLCTSGRGIALSLVQRLDGAGAFHRPGIRLFAQSHSSWLNNTASAAAINKSMSCLLRARHSNTFGTSSTAHCFKSPKMRV